MAKIPPEELSAAFRNMAAQHQSVRLFNEYKGLPVSCDAPILAINAEGIVVSVSNYQMVCLYLDRHTYLDSKYLPGQCRADDHQNQHHARSGAPESISNSTPHSTCASRVRAFTIHKPYPAKCCHQTARNDCPRRAVNHFNRRNLPSICGARFCNFFTMVDSGHPFVGRVAKTGTVHNRGSSFQPLRQSQRAARCNRLLAIRKPAM